MSIFSANLPMIKCPHNATKSGIRRLFSLSRRRLSIAAFQRLCNECFTDKSTNRSTTFIQNTIGEMVDPAPFLFRSKKEYDCPLINRSLAKIASATSVPNAWCQPSSGRIDVDYCGYFVEKPTFEEISERSVHTKTTETHIYIMDIDRMFTFWVDFFTIWPIFVNIR